VVRVHLAAQVRTEALVDLLQLAREEPSRTRPPQLLDLSEDREAGRIWREQERRRQK
jgi:hypothetical protein